MADKPAGRHSAGNQSAFYRSALVWFLPWVVVGVVGLGALWIALDAIGNAVGNEELAPLPKQGAAVVDATPTPPAEADPSPSSEPSSDPTDPPKKDKKDKKPDLITEGVSVQVLNGTAEDDADDRLAEELEGLGYEIGAVNPYLARPDSIVFWSSEEHRKAAEALAEHLGWPAAPKPDDLSSEVSIHVIVGADGL